MKSVFVVEGDAMDYEDSTWVEHVYGSLDQIPDTLRRANPVNGRYTQTYTITEWASDGSGAMREWCWTKDEGWRWLDDECREWRGEEELRAVERETA